MTWREASRRMTWREALLRMTWREASLKSPNSQYIQGCRRTGGRRVRIRRHLWYTVALVCRMKICRGGALAEACVDVCPGFSLVGYFGPATLSCSDARRAPCEGRERSRAEAAVDSRDRPVSLRLPGALPALLCRTGFQPAAGRGQFRGLPVRLRDHGNLRGPRDPAHGRLPERSRDHRQRVVRQSQLSQGLLRRRFRHDAGGRACGSGNVTQEAHG